MQACCQPMSGEDTTVMGLARLLHRVRSSTLVPSSSSSACATTASSWQPHVQGPQPPSRTRPMTCLLPPSTVLRPFSVRVSTLLLNSTMKWNLASLHQARVSSQVVQNLGSDLSLSSATVTYVLVTVVRAREGGRGGGELRLASAGRPQMEGGSAHRIPSRWSHTPQERARMNTCWAGSPVEQGAGPSPVPRPPLPAPT